MISYASPAGMAGAHHSPINQPWNATLPMTVKSEPTDMMEDRSYMKDQTSGFESGGSSPLSKDSNHSNRSPCKEESRSPTFYDNVPHSSSTAFAQMEAYSNRVSYNLLTPPGYEPRDNEGRVISPPYDAAAGAPLRVSTPISTTPPKSPVNTPNASGHMSDSNNTDHNDENDSDMDDDLTEPGINTPSYNSHGKMKTYKCKHCSFVAITKASFWEHIRVHIRPDKLIACNKCPFVTEFKHHHHYHKLKHSGFKPFRCDQCSYTCVNKSMLNSHLKSHSNVYQYRCADCHYATKYCHSLELHLRKYRHRPGLVLNADGSVNPLPIIDVYGTRRGPRAKPNKSPTPSRRENRQRTSSSSAPMQPAPAPQPTQPTYADQYVGFPMPIPNLSELSNLPCLPPLHQFLFPPNNNYEAANHNMLSENLRQHILPLLNPANEHYENTRSSVSPPETLSRRPPSTSTSTTTAVAQTLDALDLSQGKISESESPPPNDHPSPQAAKSTGKNRRKGQAHRIQPEALQLQHDEECNESEEYVRDADLSVEEPSAIKPASYRCQYCDITFGDLTMHTIHMGYHGFKDPFMCNKCGVRSADRVAFFIHLGRVEHA